MPADRQQNRWTSPTPLDLSCKPRRTIALAASAICALVAAFAGSGHAADDADVHEFIRAQAYQGASRVAPSRPSRQAFAPVWKPAPVAVRRGREPAFREARAPAPRSIREPRERYASLPRAEERPTVHKAKPAKDVAAPKPAPAAGADPMVALMQDASLRPGDIVMFPDGPRVFKGDRGVPHAAGSFEDVGQSRYVFSSFRKTVLALTKTPAVPGKAARAYLPKALPAAPVEGEREARNEAVRVIYPTAAR